MNLIDIHGGHAANRRTSAGPLDQADLLDVHDIYVAIDGHTHASPEKCARGGYDSRTHALFTRLTQLFESSYTEPTAQDFTNLKQCLTRARGYFFREYSHYNALSNNQHTDSPALSGRFTSSAEHEDHSDAKNLATHYGDLTNLVLRLEIKIAPLAKPALSLITAQPRQEA